MIQRVLTVTSGYLKFTFACMLAGTVAFFLAGMAITAPGIFLIVLAVITAVGLIVRDEVMTHRRGRELTKKYRDPKEQVRAFVEYAAFAEATHITLGGLSHDDIKIDFPKIDFPSLWVSEWHHAFDPNTFSSSRLMDKDLEKAEITSAINDLRLHQSELAAQGFYALSISKMPAEQVVKSIQQAVPSAGW